MTSPVGEAYRLSVSDMIALSVQRLRDSGVRLERGLSPRQVQRIQGQCGFTFGPEHREFLQAALPVGAGWPDWRSTDIEHLRRLLDQPVEGVAFDAGHNGFWPDSWGERPQSAALREVVARGHLELVPRLVPVFSHRYLPADAQFAPGPVFSVHQTDVIVYGDNLLDYVAHEFGVLPLHPSPGPTWVPFWSPLAGGAENRDL